jgi:hypothetical protein
LGLEEKDLLKRFLYYFFLAIEVETHAAFAAVDNPATLASLVTADDSHPRYRASVFQRATDTLDQWERETSSRVYGFTICAT